MCRCAEQKKQRFGDWDPDNVKMRTQHLTSQEVTGAFVRKEPAQGQSEPMLNRCCGTGLGQDIWTPKWSVHRIGTN